MVEWWHIKYPGNKALIEIASGASAWRVYHDLNKPQPDAMSLSADALYKMSDVELLAAYVEARRQFVEKKFTRDTHRARLEWIKAKMFISSSGGVTERNMAIEVSEEIARKGQELREMARDLDLLKVDVDIIAIVISIPRRVGVDGRARRRPERGRSSRARRPFGLVRLTVRAPDCDLQFELRHCRENSMSLKHKWRAIQNKTANSYVIEIAL